MPLWTAAEAVSERRLLPASRLNGGAEFSGAGIVAEIGGAGPAIGEHFGDRSMAAATMRSPR
jgi:hypothetical protein